MFLNDVLSLTDAKRWFITRFVEDLCKIENIQAVVLGGSYATGRANKSSDIDLGIYYREEAPFSIEDIRVLANKYDKDNNAVVVGFYEWGPWVNGGAWIHTEVGKVDILYRNINHVETSIHGAQRGIWEHHYEQQPPYGFTSMTYLAECAVCLPLFDPQPILPTLKELVKVYPQALKKTVINSSLWSAEFTLAQVDGYQSQNDMYNLIGCFTRSLKSITEALFALNEIYPIGDKHAIQILSKETIVPSGLVQKVNAILMVNVGTPDVSVKNMKALFTEVVALTDGVYEPKFEFKK